MPGGRGIQAEGAFRSARPRLASAASPAGRAVWLAPRRPPGPTLHLSPPPSEREEGGIPPPPALREGDSGGGWSAGGRVGQAATGAVSAAGGRTSSRRRSRAGRVWDRRRRREDTLHPNPPPSAREEGRSTAPSRVAGGGSRGRVRRRAQAAGRQGWRQAGAEPWCRGLAARRMHPPPRPSSLAEGGGSQHPPPALREGDRGGGRLAGFLLTNRSSFSATVAGLPPPSAALPLREAAGRLPPRDAAGTPADDHATVAQSTLHPNPPPSQREATLPRPRCGTGIQGEGAVHLPGHPTETGGGLARRAKTDTIRPRASPSATEPGLR